MSSELLLESLTPADLGFDAEQFPSYRTAQLEALEWIAYGEKRFYAACVPTGSGKGLLAVSLAKLTGARTAVLTMTKGLQGQYLRDHARDGLVDIRGRANYDCPEHDTDCRTASRLGCSLCPKECDYERAKKIARNSGIITTNYAYWLAVHDHADGIKRRKDEVRELEGIGENPIELLILDEAHSAPEAISNYLGLRLYETELDRFDTWPEGEELKEWSQWSRQAVKRLEKELASAELELLNTKEPKKRKRLIEFMHKSEGLVSRLERVETAREGEWVVERRETGRGRVWSFDVIQPGRYAERYLFNGIPKVVFMSATLRPKVRELMWVGKEQFEFREWRRVFQRSRCPIYYVPPVLNEKAIRITRKASDEQLDAWVAHIDALIDARLDRRVVVITTSYKYQERLMSESRHSRYMIGNTNEDDSPSAQEVFEEFVSSKPPVVLCSPSFGTGWDFKGDRCEFLIISKIPLRVPGGSSKLMAARLERDKEWGSYETMQDVVQYCGRPQRSEEDRAEVVITDASWEWFGHRNKHLAPQGFVGEVRRVKELPKAPKKLINEG